MALMFHIQNLVELSSNFDIKNDGNYSSFPHQGLMMANIAPLIFAMFCTLVQGIDGKFKPDKIVQKTILKTINNLFEVIRLIYGLIVISITFYGIALINLNENTFEAIYPFGLVAALLALPIFFSCVNHKT